MRVHLVVNPVAGRGRAASVAEALVEALKTEGASATMYPTTSREDAAAHFAALSPDMADRVVVVGGDGTLRDAVNARVHPLPWPLGLVPVGTANVVGRELRMPLGAPPAARARALLTAEPWAVNAMELARPDGTREWAVANAGAGLDAAIVHAVSKVRTTRGGAGGYAVWVRPVLATIAQFRFPRLRVTVDEGRIYEGTAVIVQGAHSFGGIFTLSKDAALDALDLHVSILTGRTRRDLLRLLVRSTMRPVSSDRDVIHLRAREITIESDPPVPLQADGDPAGETPVRIRLLPRALSLLRAPPPPLG
jgi:diacylglycerol kinase family enzyme